MKNNLQQNIKDLYESQFYIKEYQLKGKNYRTMRMYGMEDNANEMQKSMANHFKMMVGKYKKSMDVEVEDIMQEYSILFVEACHEMGVLEPMRILVADEQIMISRLAFIRKVITRKFIEKMNEKSLIVSTRGGKKYIDINVSSIDIEIGEDGGSIRDNLSEDVSLYKKHKESYNHFVTWVLENENYKNILTKRQAEVFEKLLEVYVPLTDKSRETLAKRQEMLREIKVASANIERMFKTIKKRCWEAYVAEFKTMQSHITQQSKALHELLNKYIDVADDPYTKTAESRAEALTAIVAKNYDSNEEFEIIITRGLKVDEKINIVRGVKGKELITHKVLRKIKLNIEKYLKSSTPMVVEAHETNHVYKEDLFDGLAKLPSVRARMTPLGVLEYKNELGEWVEFEG